MSDTFYQDLEDLYGDAFGDPGERYEDDPAIAAALDEARRHQRFFTQRRISYDQYVEWERRRRGCCAICGQVPEENGRQRLCVDHDHETGAVRGLLCHRCNVMLGWARDNSKILERAARYLKVAHFRALRKTTHRPALGTGVSDTDAKPHNRPLAA